MMKKLMYALLILGFTFTMFLFTTSCAKKQIGGEETVTKAPAEEMMKEEPKQPTMKAPPKKEMAEEKEAKQEGESPQAVKLKIEMQAFEMDSIYFDFDRDDLKPEARAILTKKAEWLRAHPEFNVRIEGNCDERGTNEYNMALGERRANSAWRFLNNLGISGERMTTISYGEERPAYLGHNERAWAKNRRDDFKLFR